MVDFELPIGPSGPIVTLLISLSTKRSHRLMRAGVPVPAPLEVPALLDTGADVTIIDHSIAQQLRIAPSDRVLIRCLDTPENDAEHLAYSVIIEFADKRISVHKFELVVAGISCDSLPYKAVLGRNLLEFCQFTYDGPNHLIKFRG